MEQVWGYYVIAEDYFDLFIFQAYEERFRECDEKINVVLKVAFFQCRVSRGHAAGENTFSAKLPPSYHSEQDAFSVAQGVLVLYSLR